MGRRVSVAPDEVEHWGLVTVKLRLTTGDCDVLHRVTECRLVATPQLAALLSRNAKSLAQRLSQLVAEGLLAEAVRGPGQRRGRPERVILPTARGVEVLQERGLIDPQLSSEAIVGEGLPSQRHQLLLNWVRAHLHHVETLLPRLTIRFLAHNSPFLPPGFSGISLTSEAMPAIPGARPTSMLKPDAAFSICDTVQGKTVMFFLEVDCGTETVASLKRTPTDIRQKIINYGVCFDTSAYKKYETLWDCELHGFRLLFVADDPAPFSALCSLARAMPSSDYVWLTTVDRMFAEGIAAEIWTRGGRLDATLQSIFGRHRCQVPLS